MSTASLIVHEVGSLAKPSWRVKAISNTPLLQEDVKEAEKWGKKLSIENVEDLLKILRKQHHFSPEEKHQIIAFSSLFGTRLMEKAGLDLVWDGEQQRVEMYEYAVKRTEGFRFSGHVRSFDNKYYNKASCVSSPTIVKPYHLDEYLQIASIARKPVKIPITGAYTIVDWSYDEHFLTDVVAGKEDVRHRKQEARRNFLEEVATQVIYPNIKALYEAGAQYIQIDEPAAATKRHEIQDFVVSMKNSIGDLAGKAFFAVHICFSDYQRLFPFMQELQGIVDEIHFEYANRDSKLLGVSPNERKGYEILKQFKSTSFIAGLGVLDVHTDFIESPELVRDRILYANEIIQDPSKLYISTDCGLRTRTWDIAFEKLKNMKAGRDLAARIIG